MESFVYAIRCGPYIKIGTSYNITARLAQLKAKNDTTVKPYDLPWPGEPLVLAGYLLGDRYVERAFHMAFAPELVAGEWFQATERIVNWAASLLQSPPDMLLPPSDASIVYHVDGPPPADVRESIWNTAVVEPERDPADLPSPVEC